MGTVCASTVVMPNALGEHHTQVLLTEDQHRVGEFGSDRADEPFGEPWFESPCPRSLVTPRFLALVSEHNIDDFIAMIRPTWIMHGGPPGLSAGEAGSRRLFVTCGRIKQQ